MLLAKLQVWFADYALKILFCIGLLVGGYFYGIQSERTAQAVDYAEALKDYADNQSKLTDQIKALEDAPAKIVYEKVIEYRDLKNDNENQTTAAIESVRADNLRLRVKVRSLEASAATAETAAGAIGNYAERTAELSRETAEYFISEAGRANAIVLRYNLCVDYVKAADDYIRKYGTTTEAFYKEHGYTVTDKK